MSGPVDIAGILERAGADADAADGTQAWALAQVGVAVAELIEAAAELRALKKGWLDDPRSNDEYDAALEACYVRLDAALANVGGAS